MGLSGIRGQRSGIRKAPFSKGVAAEGGRGFVSHAKGRRKQVHHSPLSRLRERGRGEGGGDVRKEPHVETLLFYAFFAVKKIWN